MSVVPIAYAMSASCHAAAPVDALDLSGALFGDDLVLSTQPGGRLVLHQVSDDGKAHYLGTFEDIMAVWRAVDAIDTAPREATAA
jgi:poly(3-hydroxybutyrate) depolymerase